MPNTPFSRVLAALGVVVLCAACGGDTVPKSAPQSLVNDAPVPPGAVRVSSAEGTEAVEAVYRAAYPADSVAAWYRRWFLEKQWRITGDNRTPDGMVILHAEGPGRPLWLMIRPETGGGTNFSVMSAESGGVGEGRGAAGATPSPPVPPRRSPS